MKSWNPGACPDFCLDSIVDLMAETCSKEISLVEKAFLEPRVGGLRLTIKKAGVL